MSFLLLTPLDTRRGKKVPGRVRQSVGEPPPEAQASAPCGRRSSRPPYNGRRSMPRLRLKVLLAILLVPAAAAAADSGRVLWRSQAGDDPRWARPGFDDSGWEAVPLS